MKHKPKTRPNGKQDHSVVDDLETAHSALSGLSKGRLLLPAGDRTRLAVAGVSVAMALAALTGKVPPPTKS